LFFVYLNGEKSGDSPAREGGNDLVEDPELGDVEELIGGGGTGGLRNGEGARRRHGGERRDNIRVFA
jgi:hypothetical protein